VRRGFRVSGCGSGGSGGSGWSGFGDDVPPFSGGSFFERSGRDDGRRDSVYSGSSGSGSGSGSLKYVDNVRGREEDWDNDTVSPADSISQVSSSSSARRSGGQYPQSRYLERSCGLEGGMRGLGMGSTGSRTSRSGNGMSMANGRLVRVEAPGWA
jgi:hypothetical protein